MMESTETNRVWQSGPPPHIGWWEASIYKYPDTWRWWDGTNWSQNAHPIHKHSEVDKIAAVKLLCANDIRWNDYYPANARVPRIDPRKAK